MVVTTVLLILFAPLASLGPDLASATSLRGAAGTSSSLAGTGGPALASPTCSGSALCPAQVRAAYNFTPLLNRSKLNGTGETIVIVDACGSPKLDSDLATFDAATGLPSAKVKVIDASPGAPCAQAGWRVETALDVEWAHAVAPGAALKVVVSPTATSAGLLTALGYAVSHKLGNQISASWGIFTGCPAGSSIANTVANASASNITVVASAGDGGGWGTRASGRLQAPADCAGVLSVGGTDLTLGANGTYASETAWSHSGGGYVTNQSEPRYERQGKITDPTRELAEPIVSAVASGLWAYDVYNKGWRVGDGTSFSAPIWAGLVADANSLRTAHGLSPLGSIDAFLFVHVYGRGGRGPSYATDFHDVTSGSNGYSAATGWDPATGLGSMNAYPLVQNLGTSRLA